MGMTRMRRGTYSAVGCVVMSFAHGATAEGVSLEEVPWPEVAQCAPCVNVQFGKLQLHFSPHEIENLLVVNSEASPLHVFYLSPDKTTVSATFLSQRQERFASYVQRGFFSQYGIKSNRDFFEAIGRVPDTNDSALALMRKVEGLGKAVKYLGASKGSLHVYWIQSPAGETQHVYFAIDGQDELYQLSGSISETFFQTVLGRLEIKEIP